MSVSGELRAAVLRVFLYSVCESGIDGGESAARKRIASRAAAGAGAAVRRILRDSARLCSLPSTPVPARAVSSCVSYLQLHV